MKRLQLHSRSKKYKEITYKYYSLAHSYRDENGISQKEEILRLGKLSPEEVQDYKLKLKVFNGDISQIAFINEMKYTEDKKYLDVALINHVYDSLGIGGVFPDASEEEKLNTSEIAKILTLNRCIDPRAHYRIEDWLKDSYLPELMNIDADKCNKDKIFRELDNIYERRGDLQKFFYNLAKRFSSDALELYFFDGTTSYFEGSNCELAKPGKDKTAGYQHRTILICLVTDKKGYPVTWEVFPGNKREVKEFQSIATKMAREFGIKEITLCFDRGVASVENFKIIENDLESKYISGVDQNQIEQVFNIDQFVSTTRERLIEEYEKLQKEKVRERNKRISSINGFYKSGRDRFYKELGVNKDDNRRYVVSFNIEIYERERQARLKNLDFIKHTINELNDDFLKAKKDRSSKPAEEEIEGLLKKHKLKDVLNYTIIPIAVRNEGNAVQSYRIEYEVIDEELMAKEKYDGLFVYITDHTEIEKGIFTVTAGDIVRHYRDKYVIENAFRHLKSFIELRPFFVYLDKHVIAHVDICMIAYFINTYIYHKLSEAEISLESFYSIIKSHSRVCTIDTGTARSVSLLKTLSKEVTQIVKLLEASPILSKEVLEKLNIRK